VIEVLVLAAAAAVAAAGGVVAVLSRRQVRRMRAEVDDAKYAAEEAQAIKNDFVAMVSHELRTPLTSIAGFAETLLESWKELPPAEVEEFLSIIAKQSQYLGDLVEDVLVIPRLEAGRLRFHPIMFDLGSVIRDVTTMLFAPGSGREAHVSIPEGMRVYGDPKRVHQVIRNLLENARKYGGEQVLIEGFPYGDHFVMVVSDNGPGVPDPSILRIFEHFEQVSKGDARSSSGIGLGLPIARRLARAMGGDVWYERRFPTGSRFCLSVTLSPAAAERVAQQRAEAEQDGSKAPVRR
jgi:signal transduction histidine kinase